MTAQSAGLEQRARELLAAIESLVAACEEAFTSPDTDMHEDADDDISIPPTGITFGQIWLARDALDQLKQAALAAPAADGVDDVLHKLDEWCRAYPESVFPDPTKEDFDAVNSVFPNAVTRISASMGRHMVKHMREMADAIRAAAPQAQGEGA